MERVCSLVRSDQLLWMHFSYAAVSISRNFDHWSQIFLSQVLNKPPWIKSFQSRDIRLLCAIYKLTGMNCLNSIPVEITVCCDYSQGVDTFD